MSVMSTYCVRNGGDFMSHQVVGPYIGPAGRALMVGEVF